MALTQEQTDAANEVLRVVNNQMGEITKAREDVYAALRLDVADDANIEAWQIILNAKIRAKGHADTLSALLA